MESKTKTCARSSTAYCIPMRKKVELLQAGEIGEYKGYIAAVSEDRFWNEVMPAKVRIELTVAGWRSEAVDEAGQEIGVNLKLLDAVHAALDAEALGKANVQVVEGFCPEGHA